MLRTLGLILVALSLAGCTPPPTARLAAGTPLETVPAVDADRYLGLWFEVVRADHGFERDCDGVTAYYERREDGDIRVINRCWKNGLEGEFDLAEGRARIVNTNSNAELEVSFFGPFFGDYWIIDLAEDYSWAVVSEPEGRYLWILTRDPQPSDAFIEARLAELRARGFNTDGLIRPEQWSSVEDMPRTGLPG
ncbi:lipocalin family protein [Maricaulis sp.]|uniref:lipocalin family protein n=1 Tax=Maricaulis sp. TaxID=1486257 RepID=UPI001B23A316|nr:lipocalin family protein [Maricaulis sp.]MBO6797496.1 lipocalin family protein [Maricaulis sp.]